MMPQVKNNKVQETSNSFFNMMLQLFNIVLNIKTDLIFFIFVRFFPLVKFCVLLLRILLHTLNSDQTIINTNKILETRSTYAIAAIRRYAYAKARNLQILNIRQLSQAKFRNICKWTEYQAENNKELDQILITCLILTMAKEKIKILHQF